MLDALSGLSTSRSITLPGPEIAALGCAQLADAYRKGDLSPVEVVRSTLERIASANEIFNCYCLVDAEGALLAAQQSESRWRKGSPLSPIDGVGFGVKDLLLVEGHPTFYGSRAVDPATVPPGSAPAVSRLREAGAVFLGKTTTSEFGWKGTADSPRTGVTRNAVDTALTSGGSSGGGAVAAALGLGPLQLGTDGGGSLRIPAAFNGVVGFKATFGRVPAWPPGPMLTLSNTGPMARTVTEVVQLFRVIARPDRRDWYALPSSSDAAGGQELALDRLRIGLVRTPASCAVRSSHVDRRFGELARHLVARGAVLEECEVPFERCREILETHWNAAAAFLVGRLPQEHREGIDVGLAAAADRGCAIGLSEYYSAMIERQRLGERIEHMLCDYDVLLMPTVPILPFEAGREYPEAGGATHWLDWNPMTYPFNLSRHPAISVPIVSAGAGLPIGAQVVGPLYGEQRVLGVAQAIEHLVHEVS